MGVIRRGVPNGNLVRNSCLVGSGSWRVRDTDVLGLKGIGQCGRVISFGHVGRVQHTPEAANEHHLGICLAGGGTVEEVVGDPGREEI